MSEALEVAGCIGSAGAAAAAILSTDRRLRGAALLGALVLAATLIAGQGWDDLETLRGDPAAFAGLVVGGAILLSLGAAAILRWPILLPLLLVAALPFRVRLHVAGGEAVNLLVPLYAVIGAGALANALSAVRDGTQARPLPRPLAIALAIALGLYAVQTAYSDDISFAARNVGFFLIPFAALFCLLAEAEWDRRLLGLAFGVVVAEALILALIGIGQYGTEHIFWNEKLELSNDFHFYFRVNSLFWDPNIYGRYLGLGILVAASALAWVSDSRRALGLVAVIAVIFVGLLFGFSQTSFIALFIGSAVLAALRWSVRWAVIATPLALVGVAAGALFIAGGSGESTDTVTEGHSSLISGGLRLARDRPLLGHGSASFSTAFARAEDTRPGETTISHNEPVTVAAEQGVAGVAAYLALLAAAAWTLLSGMRRIAPGLGAPFKELGQEGAEAGVARIAIAVSFCALFVHTIGYAAFLTDPLTWVLLAIGGVLAAAAGVGGWPGRSEEGGS